MKKKLFQMSLLSTILIMVVSIGQLLTGYGKSVAEAKPIKLGALLEFTGPLAEYGPKIKQGIEFKLKEANWEVVGRPIKLICEDSGTDPVIALDKAKKLVEVDQVRIIIGPVFTPTAATIAPYLARQKVIDIGLKSHAIELKKFGSLIVLPGSLYQTTYPLGIYTGEKMRYKTATTLLGDFQTGYRFQAGFKDGFKTSGGKVIQEQWAPLGTVDFGPYLVGMKKADVCLVWSPAADLMRMIKQYGEFGLYEKIGPLMIATATSLWPAHMKGLGDSILGTIGQVDYTWRIDTPINKSFVERFESEYGMKPDAEHHTAYEATSIALAAIEAIRGDSPPEKLKKAFLAIKMENPGGPLSFTKSGYAVHNIYITKAIKVGGEYAWEPIYTYPEVRHPGE